MRDAGSSTCVHLHATGTVLLCGCKTPCVDTEPDKSVGSSACPSRADGTRCRKIAEAGAAAEYGTRAHNLSKQHMHVVSCAAQKVLPECCQKQPHPASTNST